MLVACFEGNGQATMYGWEVVLCRVVAQQSTLCLVPPIKVSAGQSLQLKHPRNSQNSLRVVRLSSSVLRSIPFENELWASPKADRPVK